MKSRFFAVAFAALALAGATGCSNTVRYMTTSAWLIPAQAGAPAAAPAEGAAPAAGGGVNERVLYLTYWEGSCSSGVIGIGRGCDLGDSKIRRCNLKPDNSLVCVDEAEAIRALAREPAEKK